MSDGLGFLTAVYRDGRVHIGGKSYPAGTFAVQLLNQYYIDVKKGIKRIVIIIRRRKIEPVSSECFQAFCADRSIPEKQLRILN